MSGTQRSHANRKWLRSPREWAHFPVLPQNFVMLSALAARKMTEWCPNIWHFATLQHISSVADYTVLSVTGITPPPPLNTQRKNGLLGGGVPEHRGCAVTCRPRNKRERHRLKSHTPEEAVPKLRSIHVPPLTTSGLHAMAGMRNSGTEQLQHTTRL